MNKRQFGILMALCNGIAWGLLTPSFSLFLESLGASVALIGVIAASRTFPQFLLRIPFATFSDRLQAGKKPFLTIVLSVQVISHLLLVLTTSAYQVLVLFVIEGIAEAAFWPSIFAHMSELGTPKKSGEAMGALTFGWGSGYTIGTALVGFSLSNFRFTGNFLLAAGIGSFSIPFFLLTFEKVKKSPKILVKSPQQSVSLVKKFEVFARNPNILFAVSSGMLDAALMSAIQTFLPLYAIRGGLNEIQIGLLFTVNALVSTIVRYPVGRLSDRINRKAVLISGISLTSFVVFLIPFISNYYGLIILLALAGLGSGTGLPTRLALMLDAAPHQKALATALGSSFVQLSQSISPAVLGVLGERRNLSFSFLIVGSFSLIVLSITAILTEQKARKKGKRIQPKPFDAFDL